MSCVAQKVRTKQDTPTEVQSMTLMRNLLRTTISSITYLRHIFPEDCFRDKQLCGINIKGLVPQNDEAKVLCKWLEEGLFDALERKYLRVMIFGIYADPEQESTLIECYFFHFSYGNAQDIVVDVAKKSSSKKTTVDTAQLNSKDEIKKATVSCLRNLITISQTLKPLPDVRYLTMKLLYYEVTPLDYEPKFFSAATYGEPFSFDSSPIKIKVGAVQTPYHTLNLKLKTTVDLFEEDKFDEDMINSRLGKFMIESDTDEGAYDDSNANGEAQQEVDEITSATAVADECTEDPNHEDHVKAIRECIQRFRKPAPAFLASQFPNLSKEVITETLETLCKEGVLKSDKGQYSMLAPILPKKDARAESQELYKRCLELVLPEDCISARRIMRELGVTESISRELMKRLEKDGFVSKQSTRKGRPVIHSDHAAQVLARIRAAKETDGVIDVDAVANEVDVDMHELTDEEDKEKEKEDDKASLKRKLAEAFELSSSQDSCPPGEQPKCSKTTKPLRQEKKANEGDAPAKKKKKSK